MTEEERVEQRRRGAERARRYRAKHPKTPEQKAADKERQRLWRLANPERCRENRQRWREANPEKRAEADRRYRLAHHEEEKERVRLWALANPRKCADRQLRYKERHPELREGRLAKQRAYFATPEGKEARVRGEQRRRARKAGAFVQATAKQTSEFLKGAVSCYYCAAEFSSELPATVDHFIPLAKGGDHSLANFVAACGLCNSRKGTSLPDEFISRLRKAA
jgi:5-methylcytosine-specific restriction endonuclease McrA